MVPALQLPTDRQQLTLNTTERMNVENIKISVQGNTLVLTVDTSTNLGRSKSGKTTLIASSQGNQKVNIGGKEIFIGVNVYEK